MSGISSALELRVNCCRPLALAAADDRKPDEAEVVPAVDVVLSSESDLSPDCVACSLISATREQRASSYVGGAAVDVDG